MTKRILSVLLVLAMLLAMALVPVSGSEENTNNTTSLTDGCPCGCGLTMEQVDWQVYDPNAGGLLPGHFYLAEDYVQKDQFTVVADARIVLDLRGHTLTTKSYDRLYLVYGYLAVLDSVGGGKMCSKTTGTGNGGVMMMSYSATDGGTTALVELFSGTITADADNKGGLRGGLVSVGSRSTFRMYGGMVMNGTSQGTSKAESGGCFAVTTGSATLDVRGGQIVGGTAPSHGGNIYCSSGTVSLKNCTVIGGKATGNGGNIYMTGGKLTVENCTISHGQADGSYGGGNICAVSGTEVTIRGAVIRNGYAAKQGGNIYFGSGDQLLENATVTSGVCGTYGGNLRMTGNSVTTLDGCHISGDVTNTGTLTVKGATKIGLNNNGLNLIYDGETKAITASGLTEDAEIYVNAGTLFTDSGAKAEYFKPALRTSITETADGLVGTQVADGETGGYCPHCNQQATWTAFAPESTLVASGHYYLTEAKSVTSQLKIGSTTDGEIASVADVVLDLSGYAATATYRFAFVYSTSELTILDSVGGGSVSGKGTNSSSGGVIYCEKGTLNIYGGKYTYNTGKTVRSGGIVCTTGNVCINGGIFDATAYNNTGYNGGVLYQSSSTKLDITAGYFMGGTAKYGGAVYIGAKTTTNITGGQFRGGTATNGGTLYVAGTSSNNTGSLTVNGAALEGGYGTTGAGNLEIGHYENVFLKDCYIVRGTTDGYGGNMVWSSCKGLARYENCLILWGCAARGGNVYSASQSGNAKLQNCTVLEGTATGNGGNLAMVNGVAELSGSTLAWGKAGGNGGNIYASAGNSTDAPDNKLTITDDTMLLSGTATGNGGNIYVYGAVELDSVFINGGKAASGQDLYLAQGTDLTKLTLGANATGNVSMTVHEDRLGEGIYGAPISGCLADTLNMNITLEGDYGQPQLCVKNGALAVAVAMVADQWYATANEAALACAEGEFVKIFVDTAMEMQGDCTVDLNGKTLTVTGAGTLYGMDSSGDGGVLPTGKAILSEGVAVSEYVRADGKIYVAAGEQEATFHCLDMAITGASIRPSVDGIYYTGTWRYDSVLAQMLDTCGVAVSTVAAPTDAFMTDGTSLWTQTAASDMVSGESKTGAIISGILKLDGRTAQMNDVCGKTSIFASAYAGLKSGTTITGDTANHSLYSIMKALEAWTDIDPNTYSKYLLPARKFYEKWLDCGMGDWDFTKIPSKADDGVLDILFIGNSFTWYGKCVLDKGHNAWGLERRVNDQGYFKQICKANGVEASVTNFTFGGHELSDWYSGSCAADRGHNGLDHMQYLTDRNYDYVVLQQGSAGADLTDILAECQPLMDLFREVNPDTRFVFLVHHRVHQTNSAYRSSIKDLEEAGVLVVDWGALVVDVINGTTQVPGATQTYNQNSFVIRKSESDGYHENMLGGYITAQMLYCAITGESAVGQDYSFCGDASINSAFNFEKFLKEEYVYDPGNSNFIDIFNSPADMNGLQQLIDKYLAEKPYLDY